MSSIGIDVLQTISLTKLMLQRLRRKKKDGQRVEKKEVIRGRERGRKC